MNQRIIAKTSDTSQLTAQATLPQRLYKGSIDCGIQVNRFFFLAIDLCMSNLIFSISPRLFEMKDFLHCTKVSYQRGSEWDHGI